MPAKNYGISYKEITTGDIARLFFIPLLIVFLGTPITALCGDTSATTRQQAPTVTEGLRESYLFTVSFEPATQKGQVSLVGFGTFSVKHRVARSGQTAILNETISMQGELGSKSIEYEVSEDSNCQTGYAVFINDYSTAPDGCVPVESRSELIIFITPTLVTPSEQPDMVAVPPPFALFSVSTYLIDKVTDKVVDTAYPAPAFKAGKALKDAVN
jgi:nucleoid DNA-binding protein